MAPMPAPSSTINKTRLKGVITNFRLPIANFTRALNLSAKSAIGNWQSEMSLLFRRVVAVARAYDCYVFHAAHFEFDRAIFSVASFVGWIVTQTVLRADVLGHLRKRRARIGECGRDHASATRDTREIIHLAAREIVELAADRHSFKRTHLAEAVEIFSLRFREKDLAVTLNLSL